MVGGVGVSEVFSAFRLSHAGSERSRAVFFVRDAWQYSGFRPAIAHRFPLR